MVTEKLKTTPSDDPAPSCGAARRFPSKAATFRFYEELNDCLSPERRKRAFSHDFAGTPSVKDVIEALGVPHTAVDLILVDGEPVGFGRLLHGGERVAVYPEFERLDIAPLNRLRPQPLRRPRFVLDAHLGRLARYLRMVGLDSLYRNDYDDAEIVRLSIAERRTILTRHRGLLKHGEVTRGYWLRQRRPREQLLEVIRVFDLRLSLQPFSRCVKCNGPIEPVAKAAVLDERPERPRCGDCGAVYGERMRRLVDMVWERLQPRRMSEK